MSVVSCSTTSTTAYKVTADTTGTLVLQTGSTPTTAVTIGDDQSVAVTSNNSTAAMTITQTGTGNALVVEDSASPDSSPFVIDANGRVVIGGTSSQAGYLTTPVQIQGNSGTNGSFSQFTWANSPSSAPYHVLNKSNGTSIGTNGVVASGDYLGVIAFAGDDGTSFIRAAQISAQVDGTPGTNDMPGRLLFFTTSDGASSPTERMRIDSSGNVGIGVTPSAWSSTFKAVEIGYLGSSIATNTSNGNINLRANNYINSGGSQVYANNGYAAQIAAQPSAGTAAIQTFQSGTAGNAVTTAASFVVDQNNCYMNTANGGLGYGTGSGGTVTQATSKSTAVALNKPTGQITMNNAALAAGAEVFFFVTNTLVTTTDNVIVTPLNGAAAYTVRVYNLTAGGFGVGVKNVTGGSLSDALQINFAVIKGVTS